MSANVRLILEAIAGPASGRKIAVDDGDSLTIGRTQRSDVAVEQDSQMSGAHLRLAVRGGGVKLWDLNSLNGTLLNGAAVQQATLAHQDRITAGESVFEVRLIETSPPPMRAHELVRSDRRFQPRRVVVASDAETKDGSSRDTDAGVDRARSGTGSQGAVFDPLKKAETPTLVPDPRLPTQWFVLDVFENDEIVMTAELSGRHWTLIGRDEDAHVLIVDDTQMSKRHLCIEVDGDDCWALDLASSNGTQVNGEWITATRIHDGDLLVAGQTRFQVRTTALPEAFSEQQHRLVDGASAVVHTGTSTLMLYANAPRVRFRVYRCHSGLDYYRGTDSTFDILQLASRLSHLGSAYLIAAHASRDRLIELAEAVGVAMQPLLVDEAGDASRAEAGPWILGPVAAGARVPQITTGWSEGVMCLFSDHDMASIRHHCSSVAASLRGTSPGCSHLWSDPMLMADYLANRSRTDVERVFDPFVGLLLEVQQGDRWVLFSRVLEKHLLRMIGLIPDAD